MKCAPLLSTRVETTSQLRDVERPVDFLEGEAGIFRRIAIGLALLTLSIVVLSAAGIYALMSCTVEQRRPGD